MPKRWLARQDRKQLLRIQNTALAASGGILLSLILAYGYWMGYSHLSSFSSLVTLISGFWLGNVIIISIVVSGLNLKFKDPSLTFVQMIWASTTSVACLLLLNQLHQLIYLLIFTVLIFGTFRLSEVIYRIYCIYVVIIFSAAQWYLYHYFPEERHWTEYIANIISFSACAWVLTQVCATLVRLRERVKKKNQELQDAMEAKSLFLANMSHELRTPLNGVIGMLDVLHANKLPEDQMRYLNTAQNSAKTLLVIIDDILNFSKIEAGKTQLENIPFDILAVTQEVTDLFRPLAQKKSLPLILDTNSDRCLSVQGDPVRIRQILNNLISNAIKFTEQGQVCVRIRSRLLSDDEHEIRISVIDSGIGIPEDRLDDLFESFTQADLSTTRKYGGTGLGLAIAKQLAELMRGELTVQSVVGQGSTFHLKLILNIADVSHFPRQTTREFKNDADLAEQKILVVDDNVVNRDVAIAVIKRLGFGVDTASDGYEALTKIETAEKAFAAVLMDCQMPGLDGYQTTQKIRHGAAGEDNKKQLVIAMTANALEGDEQKCKEAGMDAYTTKPVSVERLNRVLKEQLPRSKNNTTAVVSMSDKQLQKNESSWASERLLQKLGGKDKFMLEMCESFMHEFPEDVARLSEAVADRDVPNVHKIAQKLINESTDFAATSIPGICCDIDFAAKQMDFNRLNRALKELIEEKNKIQLEIVSYLNSRAYK